MKKIMKIAFISLLLVLLLNGCNSSNDPKVDIFQYNDSYIGDASAVSNIVKQLPNSEHLNEMELITKEEPYGMILDYDSSTNDDVMNETIIHNATYIFALVKNADWITFHFGDQTEEVTKERFQDWYGEDLDAYTNKEDINELIQNHLADEKKVNQFFEE